LKGRDKEKLSKDPIKCDLHPEEAFFTSRICECQFMKNSAIMQISKAVLNEGQKTVFLSLSRNHYIAACWIDILQHVFAIFMQLEKA
jgi:hypothetical protein